MFTLKIHNETKIGFKILSEADLGFGSSHQTHIGLLENVLTFLNEDSITDSYLIYNESYYNLPVFFNYIENPDGSFRSPKIRKGDKANSVVKQIREIAQSDINCCWFLFWFGLSNCSPVFFLIDENSKDYIEITKYGFDFNSYRHLVLNSQNGLFSLISKYFLNELNKNIDKFSLCTFETKTQKFSDKNVNSNNIEIYNYLTKKIGRTGEFLVNNYFKKLKEAQLISKYKWVNEVKESYYPYDFEITNNDDSLYYLDVKSTVEDLLSYIYLSDSELAFINSLSPNTNYYIYRVYALNLGLGQAKLKIFPNVSEFLQSITRVCNDFSGSFKVLDAELNSFNLKFCPKLEYFDLDEIDLM